MLKQLSDKEYRALPYESFSSIKCLVGEKGPQTFLYCKNNPFQGNYSTLLGTAVHHYLQGNRHLVTVNNISKRSNAGKEAHAKFEEEFKSMGDEEAIIVPKAFEDKLNNILNNFNENSKCTQLFEDCLFEPAYVFEVDGVKLKGKLDGVTKGCHIIEIKTSSQATNIVEFREEAKERHYDMQAYAYLEAHRQATGEELNHYFIVANTQAPFAVNRYPSGKEFLKEGKKKLHEAVGLYKKYIVNGEVYEPDEEYL